MKAFMLRSSLLLTLRVHNACYRWAASIAIRLEGVHPKHRLMRYKEWFLHNLSIEDVVLDVGSNTGAMPRLLAQRAAFVYGIEIDSNLVEQADRQGFPENVEFFQGDATSFDFRELQPISVVTLSNVLEHIQDRAGFLTALLTEVNWKEDATRRFLIRVPAIDRDWITLYKRELGVECRLDPTHFTEYTEQDLRSELKSAGLSVTSLEVRFGEIYAVCEGS
jgi:SAM-dependent methyltransferase